MNHNYVAMAVALLIWGGLFAYLVRLEKKVEKLNQGDQR
jgi:hypothetical protein